MRISPTACCATVTVLLGSALGAGELAWNAAALTALPCDCW